MNYPPQIRSRSVVSINSFNPEVIVAPADATDKVLSLAREYRERFHQEAVLVVTSAGDAIFVEGDDQ